MAQHGTTSVPATDGRVVAPHWPTSLLVEPCTFCNLRCPLCVVGSAQLERPQGVLDVELHERLVAEVAGRVRRIAYHGQGEPFLHPQFLELVRQAHTAKIRTSVSTNGHFLQSTEACDAVIASGLGHISVSLDGATPVTYSRYRVGGDFHRVVEGIRRLLVRRRQLGSETPRVQLQCIVFRHNEAELPQVRRLADSLGVDVLRLKTAQVLDPSQLAEYAPADDRLCRYERGGRLKARPRALPTCWYVLNQPFVAADGRVAPCCFDKQCRFAVGSLATSSLQEIWNSPAFEELRDRVRDRNTLPLCANCSDSLEVQPDRKLAFRRASRADNDPLEACSCFKGGRLE